MLHLSLHLPNKFITRLGCCLLGLSVLGSSFTSHATTIKEDSIAVNQAIAVESNARTDWPQGPIVSASSAILMEAETGVILYEKNIHAQEYPASTTKILTTLIAAETCAMDEMVTFSYKATHDIDPGSNHIGMDADEQLPMEDCLKAILIRSANEVSFAVAEHIAKDNWEAFAPIMNERAKELGAINSNFVNPNGLPNEEHVTTAYDLAMIGRAFFDNELLCKMTMTKQLHLYPTEVQPDEIWENNQMSLLPGKEYAYEYLVGCKTGYTNAARSCLVSCAEKDGLKLICVVLKDEAPYQYEDTIALFEYGFSNFEKRNISENETKYDLGSNTLSYSEEDIFGSSQPILSVNKEDYVVLPKTADFNTMKATVSYETSSEEEAALIRYTYHDVFVGSASIDFALGKQADYTFEVSTGEDITSEETTNASTNTGETKDTTPSDQKEAKDETPSFFFVNIKNIMIIVGCIVGVVIIGLIIMTFLKNYQINIPSRNRRISNRINRHRLLYKEDLSVDLRKKRKQQIADAKRRQRRARRR